MEQDSLQQIRNNHLADILCALRTNPVLLPKSERLTS